MKRIRIVVLIMAIIFSSIPMYGKDLQAKDNTNATDISYVINGDFETGKKSPWEGFGDVSSAAKKDGQYGYLLTDKWVQQKVTLKAGYYKLTADIKTVVGTGSLSMKDYPGQSSEVSKVELKNNNKWTSYELLFCMESKGVATLFLETDGIGRIDSDNFKIIKLSDITEEKKEMLTPIPPTIYPFFVNPEEYPAYDKRPYSAITWDSLNGEGKTLLTAGRGNAGADTVDNVGEVYRPDLTWLYNSYKENKLSSKLAKMKERGEVLHNIGGYGPGTPFGLKYGNTAGFGEYHIPKEILDTILASGVRFTGFDIGEQDGRYNFTYTNYHHPYIQDKVKQYINTQPFFDKVAETQLQYGSLLSVLWYWHYPIKEGYTTLAGAETQNKITNSQVHYSFLRGAGKQYGVLWYGDVSVFDTWGFKGGWGDDLTVAGPSLGLLKKEYFSQYLYNSTILSFEEGWKGKDGQPTGIGKIHNDADRFIKEHGNPGVMHTPVALLNDFYSGWQPAKQIANKFVSWNQIPYAQGDWLFDGVLSMVYPNYEESGYHYDETGARTNAPYGEIADSILSDASLETMKQYGVMVAAGDLFSWNDELKSKINDYITDGGNFIVTAENAKRLWPEWEINGKSTIGKNSKVKFTSPQGEEEWVSEDNDFTLYDINKEKLPQGSRIVATTEDNKPVVIEIKQGNGIITLDLTPFGINESKLDFQDHGLSTYNVDLGRPYTLTAHTKKILDERFASQQLFTVGDDLGHITCYKGDGEYTVGIYNNSLSSKPFKIESNAEEILEIKELKTVDLTKDDLWGPHPDKVTLIGGKNDSENIFAGDIRIFQVKTANTQKVKILEKSVPQKIEKKAIAVENFALLKDQVRSMPTFLDNFDGVKVDWKEINGMDKEGLKDTDVWRKRQQIQTIVDFSSDALDQTKYEDVLDKMSYISGATDVIVAASENIETLKSFASYAKTKGINVHLKSDTFEEVKNLITQIQQTNVYWAFATKQSKEIEENINKAGDQLGILLVTPDSISNDYSSLAKANVVQILDGSYNNWNDIYQDIKTIWLYKQGSLKMKLPKESVTDNLQTKESNQNVFLALHDITNLEKELANNKDFYDRFGGVMLDYEYLYWLDDKSTADLKKWLDQKDLKIIVDFSRSIDHFIDLTLSNQVEEDYNKSKIKIDNVFDKMQKLGIKDAMIASEAYPEANGRNPETGIAAPWGDWGQSDVNSKASFINGVKDLTMRAEDKGITVHMQNTGGTKLSSTGEVKNIVDSIHKNNLKVAMNGNYTNNLAGELSTAGSVDIIVLGAQDSLANSTKAFYKSGQNPAVLENHRNAIKVLDGEYANWNEIMNEYDYIKDYIKIGFLLNGDFETGNKAPYVGYGEIAEEAKKDGKYGYKLDGLFMQQEVHGLQPGNVYTVKVNLKSIDGSQGFLFIKDYGGKEVKQYIDSKGEWMEYTLTFTMGDTGLVKIGYMREPDSGIVYLDNFILERNNDTITVTSPSAIDLTQRETRKDFGKWNDLFDPLQIF